MNLNKENPSTRLQRELLSKTGRCQGIVAPESVEANTFVCWHLKSGDKPREMTPSTCFDCYHKNRMERYFPTRPLCKRFNVKDHLHVQKA